MKIDNSYHIKAAKNNLKKELDNLNNAHKNEVESVKLKHANAKSQLDEAYKADLFRVENEGQKKLIETNARNEETLTKLQESLDNVKERIGIEKNQIQEMNEQKKNEERILFEAKIQDQHIVQKAKLEDLHHAAQIENQKLARSSAHEKQQIEFNSNVEKQETLGSHKLKVETSKNIFDKEYHVQVEKYRDALKNQRTDFENEAVRGERKHQSSLEQSEKIYKAEAELIKATGDKKLADLQKFYEEKFAENSKLTQESLQELNDKKEKLENDLITSMKENVELEVNKEEDPFYRFQKLAPKIGFNSENNAYTLEIETTAEAAKDYKLTAHGRELKLQMKRDYKFANTNEAGIASSTNKFESYSTKIPVDEIINPKKVSKNFKDGLLTFEIKLA